jgi:hypothetical protein
LPSSIHPSPTGLAKDPSVVLAILSFLMFVLFWYQCCLTSQALIIPQVNTGTDHSRCSATQALLSVLRLFFHGLPGRGGRIWL